MVSKPFIISLPFEDSPSKTTSTKFLQTLKGVKQWWTPRHQRQRQENETDNVFENTQPFTKEGIALTLTAPITVKNEIQTATILNSSNLLFKPHSLDLFTNNTVKTYNAHAFVHYDPTKNFLALGANSETHPTQSIWLTLDRYAWLILQLQEEKYIETFLKTCSLKPSFSSAPDQQESYNYHNSGSYLNSNPYCILQNPILAICNEKSCTTKPLARRLTRLVRGNSNNNNNSNQHHSSNKLQYQHQHQHQSMDSNNINNNNSNNINNSNKNNNLYLFMLPKSLLLQAASYIPMTKPLPPIHLTENNNKNGLPELDLSKKPFIHTSREIEEKTKHYIKSLTLSSHDLFAVNSQSTTESSAQKDQQHQLYCLICNRCGKKLDMETMSLSRPTTPSIQLSQHSQLTSSSLSNTTTDHDNNSDDEDHHKMPSIRITKPKNNKREAFDSTFTITYFQPIINTSTESTHLFPHSTRPYSLTPTPIMIPTSVKQADQASSTFNTFPRRQVNTTMHRDSLDHLSYSDSISSSGAATGSFSLPYYHQHQHLPHHHNTHSTNFEAKGYIVVDHTRQEIHVVFPDLMLHHHQQNGKMAGLDPSFFSAAVWEEEDHSDEENKIDNGYDNQHHYRESRTRKISKKMKLLRKNNDARNEKKNNNHSSTSPTSLSLSESESTSKTWVLNGALIAWRRCELNVATLLMRIAQNTPQHYGVVFIGHGLGS
ncbi:hypothetical protein BJ944DRAFT_273807, partial [Cunninghamella echinulata]